MADPFIGEIRMFGFNFNPRGWFLCNGALLAISQHSTLFSLLGTYYGGDGRATFALPDLRGRTPVSKGRHPGSFYDWSMGQQAGSETHTLTAAELASHTHTAHFTATSTSQIEASLPAVNDVDGDTNIPASDAIFAKGIGQQGAGHNANIFVKDVAPNVFIPLKVSGSAGSGVVTVDNTGSNREFNIVQPLLVINFCIAHAGVYPPRP